MAKTNQDWYNGKGPMGHYGEMCKSRNHDLISLSGVEDGSGLVAKGTITFYCNTCRSEMTTSVASYCATSKNSTSKGCKSCKKSLAVTREAALNLTRPPSKNRTRRRIWKKHSPFKSRDAIKQHLRSEVNAHNQRMLELMDRKQPPPPPVGEESNEWYTKYELHHIIPCHDGGEERVYNEIKLTRYEHWEIHLLRFEAYGQFGDVYIFNFCWKQLPEEFKIRLRANPRARRFLAKVMADST